MNQRQEDLVEIKRIIANKDSYAVEERIFGLITKYPRDEEILKLLCEIFEANWHSQQEDLASAFQHIKNPSTAKSLFNRTFTLVEYDEWNDTFPMQRKCVWALADIGTSEAKKYLKEIELKANKTISSFASKRLENWEKEFRRKGQMIVNDKRQGFNLTLENYTDSLLGLPKQGNRIIANTLNTLNYEVKDYSTGALTEIQNDYIVVYQAYKNNIAEYAINNQIFGGSDFSYSRMSWIKPNFLWMMYRCGWAEKENQERVLAIWIKKENFEEILSNATFTSYQSEFYDTEQKWRAELEIKKVRLQWDPDHDPYGNKLTRRAIQLGLKDEVLEKFGKEQIECILDITDFVKEQKGHIDNNRLDKLLVPKERIVNFENIKLNIGIDI